MSPTLRSLVDSFGQIRGHVVRRVSTPPAGSRLCGSRKPPGVRERRPPRFEIGQRLRVLVPSAIAPPVARWRRVRSKATAESSLGEFNGAAAEKCGESGISCLPKTPFDALSLRGLDDQGKAPSISHAPRRGAEASIARRPASKGTPGASRGDSRRENRLMPLAAVAAKRNIWSRCFHGQPRSDFFPAQRSS